MTIRNGEAVSGVRLVIDILGRVYGKVEGLQNGETAYVRIGNRIAEVQPNGDYDKRGIADGVHELVVRTSLSREASTSVKLDPNNREQRVDIVFSGSSTLRGMVTTADDTPLPFLEVIAVPIDGALTQGKTQTEDDGSYRIVGLDDGKYQVEIPRYNKKFPVEISVDTVFDITLGEISLSGSVAAKRTVRGAIVFLSGFESNQRFQLHAKVDNSGRYEFVGLEPGSFEVIVVHDGFREYSQTVKLNAAKSNFDIYLVPEQNK